MLKTHNLHLPLDESSVRDLSVGDLVYLSGEIVVSAGLPTYQRLTEFVNDKKPLPLDFSGGTLFHVGSMTRENEDGYEMLYLNPTTSTRFNQYMPTLIRGLGLRLTGGKGGLDLESVHAMKEAGCIYLSFLGGGCALLSEAIREVTDVYWKDLITHYRLVKVRVENLGPLTVGIDVHGNSVYEGLTQNALSKLLEILTALKDERQAGSHE
ncbi:fumarate hydratase subunit beta [Paraburkholderia sp. BL18I3N2]|uniref:fumarate hydratase C-terminal domain-containing protein n=1 Tax=Paraburkholderia sp. BL18I3N2 TaxID=1938799 RepID=UPI000D05FF8C|nr:fumarate hydratase C-terminal domain-containing protein [Paraburkholderia sp. BL18I3N2]PRX32881.1 fumarate hydratase subunit beta [Paraburkholderia sp. BL18I3N2]